MYNWFLSQLWNQLNCLRRRGTRSETNEPTIFAAHNANRTEPRRSVGFLGRKIRSRQMNAEQSIIKCSWNIFYFKCLFSINSSSMESIIYASVWVTVAAESKTFRDILTKSWPFSREHIYVRHCHLWNEKIRENFVKPY